MINDGLVDAKIQIHGAPPTDLEQQRTWYRDVLRDSLKLAAKTTLVLQNKGGPSSEQQNTSGNPSNIPYLQELPRTGIQSYNTVGVATPTRDPQIPSMGHPLGGMDAITPTFLSQSSATSAPSSVMTGDMTEPGWGEFPQLLVEEMVHSYEPRYSNYDLSQNYGSGFDQTEPDIMDSQYQHWPMQQGRRRVNVWRASGNVESFNGKGNSGNEPKPKPPPPPPQPADPCKRHFLTLAVYVW